MRHLRILGLSCFVSLFLLNSFAHSQTFELAKDERVLVSILLPAKPSSNEILAARELRIHLEALLGQQVVVDSIGRSDLKPISVGRELSPRAASLVDKRSENQPDSFAIVVDKEGIQLAGRSDSGTLIAAYELLEQLGVRWYQPGIQGTLIPSSENPRVSYQETVQGPSFPSRHLQGGLGLKKDDWKVWLRRNRCGGPVFPFAHGMRLKKEDVENYPEIRALVDGKRQGPQLCLSNPRTLELVLRAVRKYFHERPEETWIGLGPEDGDGFCECTGCQGCDGESFDPYKGGRSYTDRYVWFFNQILENLETDLPEKKIGFYAYHSYMLPPVRHRPSTKIVPALANINLCRIHGPGNPVCSEQVAYLEILKNWKTLVPEVYDRGYWSNLADPGLIFPSFDKVVRQIQVDREYDLSGFRIECFHHWASEGPLLYLAMRLMWSVETDGTSILEDYYRGWFGPAGKEIGKFYGLFDEALASKDFHAGGAWDLPAVYDAELLSFANEHLTQAEQLVEDWPLRNRVATVRKAFEATRDFIHMHQRRAQSDYPGALAALSRIREAQKTLQAGPVPQVNPRFSSSFLERYFGKSIEDGALKASKAVVEFDDIWLSRQAQPDEPPSAVFFLPTTDWRPLKTSSSTWSAQDLRYYRGAMWYRQSFRGPRMKSSQIRLWIGAIDDSVRAWLNGEELVLSKVTAFLPCEAVVPPSLLRYEAENELLIQVGNSMLNEIGVGGLIGPVMLYGIP